MQSVRLQLDPEPRVSPSKGWPREVVVEHDDGTVSLLANVDVSAGTVRCRRAGDVFREEMA
jgi:hypothetical protein